METPGLAPTRYCLEYCVIIAWKTRAQARVRHFACVEDAQR